LTFGNPSLGFWETWMLCSERAAGHTTLSKTCGGEAKAASD
jgi:hypothetical protein